MTDKIQQIESAPNPDQQRNQQDQAITEALNRIKNKILIMSGKGGVGKSSVAVGLAVSRAQRGKRVGLMDVDLHGPSVPRMLGLEASFPAADEPRPIPYPPNLFVASPFPIPAFRGAHVYALGVSVPGSPATGTAFTNPNNYIYVSGNHYIYA